MKMLYPIVTAWALAALSIRASATPGGLDSTFGGTGKVIGFVAPSSAEDIVAQSDGKIVVVGTFGTDAVIIRYVSAGSVDIGFNGTGKVVGKFGPAGVANRFSSVALQSDGKVVAGGTVGTSNPFDATSHDFLVVRRNTDGSSNQSTTPGINGKDVSESVAIQVTERLFWLAFSGM